MFSLSRSKLHVLMVGTFLAQNGAALADFAVRVEGQPPRLVYPAPDGSNYILTVSVSGGEAAAVWLTTGADAMPRVAFRRVGAAEFQINLNLPEIVELVDTAGPAGAFHVSAESVDGALATSVFINYISNKAPRRLSLSEADRRMKVYQRSSHPIPGSGEYLFLSLGDITGGQANLSIRDKSGGVVVIETPVRKCDVIRLVLADGEYAVQVDDLVNLLIGNDYALISVLSTADAGPQAIARLLKRIKESGLVFLRNETEMTAAEFANWLHLKHTHSDEQCVSVESFIERIGTKSSTSGSPYMVVLKSGERIEAEAWLREQAADDLSAEAKSAGDATRP